jgi:tRNA (guanine-N7-)-methyltransferase
MGRRGLSRSVKRVPPSQEALARYLHLWRYEEAQALPDGGLPRIDAQTLFGRELPLELEVGCGTGEFLNALAAERPETGFVGVDVSTKSLFLAVRQASDLGLQNVRYFRAPMDALYPRLVPDSLSTVYVHFPDPFVRGRGQHRILNLDFIERMRVASRVGGLLSVVSDKPELFHEVLDLVEGLDGWEKTHSERFLLGYEPPVKSRYQVKWERFDLTAMRFELRKLKPAA